MKWNKIKNKVKLDGGSIMLWGYFSSDEAGTFVAAIEIHKQFQIPVSCNQTIKVSRKELSVFTGTYKHIPG